MNKLFVFILLLLFGVNAKAQLVEVQADYNGNGDCVFSAHNNAKTPIFLKIDFADLQNTSFPETLPYVKQMEPGFNSLFTLERYPDADVPRFNYQMKTYRSNPNSIINLDFPYLFPFKEGSKIKAKEIKSILGFRGVKEPESWFASGFQAKEGDAVFVARQGIVVEIARRDKGEDQQNWYNTWNNSITLLQPDGTLICYRNVVNKSKTIELNQKIHPGQKLGEIATGASELILLIYQNSLSSDKLRFIIPKFCVEEKKFEILNIAKEYHVVHPLSVRGLEMSKKEKRKVLGGK
jgi:hypothetical protein